MNELINFFKDWPVILQGAIGSALFWLFLFLGQKAVAKLSREYSNYSVKARMRWLTSAQFKYALGMSDCYHDESAHFFSVLIYRSLRDFYKALMWVVLALLANTMFYPLGVIGYLGALVYLFRAFEVVAPVNLSPELCERKLLEVTNEINEQKET